MKYTRNWYALFVLFLLSIVSTGCTLLTIELSPPVSEESGGTIGSERVVTLLSIPGIEAPVAGHSPASIIETTQYAGTISWSPEITDYFVSNTQYTSTIVLMPRHNYTLEGVGENTFTVDGASNVTHAADSGVLTVEFPPTPPNLSPVTDLVSPTIGTLKAVQGGTFHNGTADMTVSSFRMSQYEITGTQYAALMGVDPSYFSSVPDHPVEKANFYHAITFCNKLSILEGLTPVYSVTIDGTEVDWEHLTHDDIPIYPSTLDPKAAYWEAVTVDWGANGYRLPTEAEWEFAARGGIHTQNYIYAGSNNLDDVAWYQSNSSNTTHTVGTKMPNELGLYDMSGNVHEWCWDRESTYPATSQTDYRGPSIGTKRIVRGGFQNSVASQCETDYRGSDTPTNRNANVGFRVVRP